MKVKAKQMGFYDMKRRHEGEVFMLHDKAAFSEKWMEAVDGKAPTKKAKAKVEVEDKEPGDDVI